MNIIIKKFINLVACPAKPCVLAERRRGFTLIETLIALFILSISVVSIISMTAQSSQNANFAKNKLTASYLAAEVIEGIRNMKDGETWVRFKNVTSSCGLELGCPFDISSVLNSSDTWQMNACLGDDECGTLFFNETFSGGGFYTLNPTSNKTPFKRVVFVKSVSENEISVTSKVSWLQGSIEKSISMNASMFDWNN